MLELEQQKTSSLLEQLALEKKRNEIEKEDLIDQIAEAHASESQLREMQLKRLAEKNAKLTR